ncbi:MalY/PatB family protein [Planctomycetota bacterium]
MAYNFDKVIDRRKTSSLKWELYKDRDIIPMWVADMDFAAPPAVIEAVQRRVDHGVLAYSVPPQELVDAVIERMARLYNWKVEAHWIVWLPGMVVALNLACRCVGEPGDECLTFTPIYPPFLSAPPFSDRSLVKIPLTHDGRRTVIDLDALEAAMTPRTRVLQFCNPHNPGGRAFTRNEILAMAEICLKHDLVICSDEIHCDLILDEDTPHIPTATLSPEIAAQTITLMSPSKTFNIPGLNCAYAIIPDMKLRRQFTNVRRGIVPHVGVFGYEGAIPAYTASEDWYQALIPYLRLNRDLVEATIADIPGLAMEHLEATYLAWIDARKLGIEKPTKFFENAGVGLSNGKDFDAEGFVRLNFGCPRATLEEGLKRMRDAVTGKPSSL